MLADLHRALSSFDNPLYVITLPGDPHPKGRPSFGQGRAFTRRVDLDAEAETARLLAATLPAPLEGNVAIACLFYRRTRRRVDADNLVKHVCDAANGVLWKDDSQVTAELGVVELDRSNPRTVILLSRHDSTMER
ncbi:RusA family crossover junction endodeoxyribonuclease [Nocardia asteroides]|uniref:RusA family crossover junction endodeoxyribonuclease n=1 Tax=Nocardia asteroides TaxID=1824 RepID=UPI0037C68568